MLNKLITTWICISSIACVWPLSETHAQKHPDLTKDLEAEVFDHYAATLDNAVRAHRLGYQVSVIRDFEEEDKDEPVPRVSRGYGMTANVEDGKFRRVEFARWFMKDEGLEWDVSSSQRFIANSSGMYAQNDPGIIFPAQKMDSSIGSLGVGSPLGMLFVSRVDNATMVVEPTSIEFLERTASLVWAGKKKSQLEAIWMPSSHMAAGLVVFDENFGGMAIELRSLWRDKKFQGADKLGKLKDIQLKEIFSWPVIASTRAYLRKITDEKEGDLWYPEIIDYKERGPAVISRSTYYFVDWKAGKQVDHSIFDHKPFEKRKGDTIYAETAIYEEYQARQNELDAKVLALRKKWKFE